ncbi:synaptotagmin-like protein 2 [Protopterus annectens]|uniref:synaptotagmin-like protein 2 n=1 Tax=Protopterus annectens TaxID=7888 RepID=UPI001CFB066B|nr:synaptotagmin-like protein 2 [Protopterus annectens]XP_043913148.1 synaptotagmin-like protein 2 [Protopterus annectens]
MLDLSFLTEEEQENILKVLKRDADLKKKDDERIRKVQRSIKDNNKKKWVTGEWFEEVKAHRFQDILQGPELIQASVRRKRSSQETNVVQNGNGSSNSLPLVANTPTTESSAFEYSRFDNDQCEKQKQPKPLPKSNENILLEHSTLPQAEDQTETIFNTKDVGFNNTSPVDSGIGESPLLIPVGDLQLCDDNDDKIQSPVQKKFQTHQEKDITRPDYFAFAETSSVTFQHLPDSLENKTPVHNDGLTELSKKSLQDSSVEVQSKIPVKKKVISGLQQVEISSDLRDHRRTEYGQQHSPVDFGSALPEAESDKMIKNENSFSVASMKDKQKEQDTITDPTQFHSLMVFWETGVHSGKMNDNILPGASKASPERHTSLELERSCDGDVKRSTCAGSDKFQTGQDRTVSNIPLRKRISYSREAVVSSSEDETNYVVTPRRGPLGTAPRSSYKGATMGKSINFSESTGSESVNEECRNGHKSTKKSKLPVKMSSQSSFEKTKPQPDVPSKEKNGNNECHTQHVSQDENMITEKREQVTESLQNKDTAALEAENSVETEHRDRDSITEDCKDVLPSKENKHTETVIHDSETTSYGDSSTLSTANSGTTTSAAMMALTRAGSSGTAKSMVNIYTSTETYSKPLLFVNEHTNTDLSKSKEFSKSTPALLNESESDSASEISLRVGKHKKTPSNASNSSDLASVSSVSGSVLSVYSGDFGNMDAQGSVQFALDYNEKNKEFQIYVAQCSGLAIVDEKKARSDPYVKTYLLPDKARMGKRKTSVKKRTVNPVYNEIVRYKIEKSALLAQKLNLSVWHNDPLGRNSFLGENEVDLTSWDWSNRKLNWYPLKPRCPTAINGVDHRGMIYLSIKYIPPGTSGFRNPPTGEVHIWVKDCKDLPQLRLAGVDSFVKCYVLPDTSKKSFQKTRVVKKDTNPVFNHTIVYDGFHTEDLKDACVELTVWDHEKLTNHFLGGVRLGLGTGFSYGIPVDWMDSTQEEVALWQDMMSTPNEWIEGSLALRSSLGGKKKLK